MSAHTKSIWLMKAGIIGMIISFIAMVVASLPPQSPTMFIGASILLAVGIVVFLSCYILNLIYERREDQTQATIERVHWLQAYRKYLKQHEYPDEYPAGDPITIQPLPADREIVLIPSLDELLETDNIPN